MWENEGGSVSNSNSPSTPWYGTDSENTRICPQCKGTGLDRWEDDDCERCTGEGYLLA